MATLELSRELIALARQGGAALREPRRPTGGQGAKDKAAARPGAAGGKDARAELARSPSLPSMGAAGAGTRRGGGWATMKGNDMDLTKFKEKVDAVLTNKANLDYCEKPFFRTALWEAAWKNHGAIVRLLANKGASVSAADYQGRTPLHEAAFYGHAGLLEFLLEKGHPIDCVDVFGQTPLFRAVEGGRHEVVRLLVERGAHTNQVDSDNVTVQHVAAFQGMPVLSQYLLNSGACKNRFGVDEFAPSLRSSPGVAFSTTKGNVRSPLKAGATLMLGDVVLPQRRIL